MKSILTCVLLALLVSVSYAQQDCYDLSVQEISLDPDPIPPVELNGMTTLSFLFCNDLQVLPNDSTDKTTLSICPGGLVATGEPQHNFFDIEWIEFSGCWFGTVTEEDSLQVGCDTIRVDYDVTFNSSETIPQNSIAVNIQPSGIVVGNDCFDPEDDFVAINSYTLNPNLESRISGRVVSDEENCDGIHSPLEIAAAFYPLINTTTGDIIAHTNIFGFFDQLLYVPLDDSLDLAPVPFIGFSLEPEYRRIINDGTIYEDQDFHFCHVASPSSNLAVNLVSPWSPIAGGTSAFKICVQNNGSIDDDAVLDFSFTNKSEIEDYITFTEVADAEVDGLDLSWEFINFKMFDRRCYEIEASIDPSIPIGTLINTEVNVSTTTGLSDFNPLDNTDTLSQRVASSSDPITKTVTPDSLPISQIAVAHNFEFLISFQNEGDVAVNKIIVLDTISENFDMKTFKMLSSSFEFDVEITILDKHVIQWTFDDISLPPKIEDEEGSRGFVQYAISSLSGLEVQDKLRNKAEIFFDSNDPITTNTAEVVFYTSTNTTDISLQDKISFYPNPAKNILYVESLNLVSPDTKFQLLDINGKIVKSTYLDLKSGEQQQVELYDLESGIYLLKLIVEENTIVKKLIIE